MNFTSTTTSPVFSSLTLLPTSLDARIIHKSVCPISKLPVEVMQKIFRVASTADPYEPVGPLSTLRNITHVCRYWREAALNSPVLWTPCFHYLTYDRNWMKAILIRSAPHPFDLRIHALTIKLSRVPVIPTERRPTIMENAMLAIEDYSRARQINIIASEVDALQILQRIQGPAPFLRSLKITTNKFTGPWDHINIGPTPMLQHLSLTNSPISWNSFLFRSNLIHLEISSEIDTVPSPLTSTISLLDILDGLPLLENLVLSNIFTSAGLHQVPGTRRVSLSRLSRLSLLVHSHMHVQIVGHLSFPQSTTLRVIITRGDSAANALALLKRYLCFEFSRVDLRFLETGLVFHGWQSGTSSDQPRLVVLSKHTYRWGVSSMEELSQFMPLLPLWGVRDFCYATESSFCSLVALDLNIIWDSLTNLESLTLCGSESNVIPTILDASRTSPDKPLPLPNLKRLVFKHSTFLKSHSIPHSDWHTLIKMLKHRSNRNEKLKTLIFCGCTLPSARKDELQNAVETLEVLPGDFADPLL